MNGVMIGVATTLATLCALTFQPAVAQSDGLDVCVAPSGALRVPRPGQQCKRQDTPVTLATPGSSATTQHLRWVDSTGNVVSEFVSPPLIVASNRPLSVLIATGEIYSMASPHFESTNCTGTPYIENGSVLPGIDDAYIPVETRTIYARDLTAEAVEIEARSHWLASGTMIGCSQDLGGGFHAVLGTPMTVVGELPAFSFPLRVELVGDGPNF